MLSSVNRKFEGYLVFYSLRNLTSLTFAFAHLVLFLFCGLVWGMKVETGVSLHTSGCPGLHYVEQASLELELRNLPTHTLDTLVVLSHKVCCCKQAGFTTRHAHIRPTVQFLQHGICNFASKHLEFLSLANINPGKEV